MMPPLPRTLDLIEYVLMALGGVVLLACIIRWVARGRRDPLRGSPIRANRLTPVLVWVCFLAHLIGWTIGAKVGAWAIPPGLSEQEQQSWSTLLSANVAQMLVGATCLAVAAVAFRRSWRLFGFGRQPIGSDFMHAVGGCLVAICLCNLVVRATTMLVHAFWPDMALPEHSVVVILRQPSVALSLRLLAIGGAFVLAPVSEELFFRGIVQTGIKKLVPHRWGSMRHRWIAVGVTSAFFALMHWSTWHHMPALLVLAAILGYTYERRGSLVAPVLLHMLFNGRTLLWSDLLRWYASAAPPTG